MHPADLGPRAKRAYNKHENDAGSLPNYRATSVCKEDPTTAQLTILKTRYDLTRGPMVSR